MQGRRSNKSSTYTYESQQGIKCGGKQEERFGSFISPCVHKIWRKSLAYEVKWNSEFALLALHTTHVIIILCFIVK